MRNAVFLAAFAGVLGGPFSNIVQAVINVPADEPTIQTAINVALSGVDVVVVAPGTYHEIIDFLGKAITVRSSDPTNPAVVAATIIDATGVVDPGDGLPVVRCDTGEGADTVLNGFTITGGTGHIGPVFTNGGGMFNEGSSPTVMNCVFVDNDAWFGGGMRNRNGSSPTVTNCTFNGNASNQGGGMMNTEASSPTLTNCVFSGNSASGPGSAGGGMRSFVNSIARLINCTFSGNTAGGRGGGMFVANGSDSILTNCIFWMNSDQDGVDETAQISAVSAVPEVYYSDVQGGWTGIGSNNINADPLFVDADGTDDNVGTVDDNLRLSAGSPCIDAGSNADVPAGVTTDLDGFSRFIDDINTVDTGTGTPPIVDLGAYEFPAGDCDASGNVNLDDYAHLEACVLGPETAPGLGCGCFDQDGDGDVDLRDAALFMRQFTGPI